MCTVVFVSDATPANDALLWLASSIAESSDSAMLLVGVADIPPWILCTAPLAGACCTAVPSLDLMPTVDAEVRRCVALVPNELNLAYSCWLTWDDKNLLSFLARAYRPTIVAQWARPMTRARRKPQAIANRLDGTLITLRSGAVARSRTARFDDRGLSQWAATFQRRMWPRWPGSTRGCRRAQPSRQQPNARGAIGSRLLHPSAGGRSLGPSGRPVGVLEPRDH
jgi:hypothetical protein